jgi:LmbE family N-acetylglucosaminyl deacetylase
LRDVLTFTSAERVLILAPHPDDESIATGGIVQAARVAGAALRVIVLTDGDANFWPQRWIEKRWRIDAAARARWGVRRRAEARAAMGVLGLGAADADFLGLPDLGLTDLLMRGDTDAVARLRAALDAFMPSCLVLPDLSDRHPDHSAAHILARLALRGSAAQPQRLLGFAVHGGAAGGIPVACELSQTQQQVKRQAIQAHATQMRLSRGRFLRHAGAVEEFHALSSAERTNPRHPLRARADAEGRIQIDLDRRGWRKGLRGLAWFVVLDGETPRRLRIDWKSGATPLPILDTCEGSNAGAARVVATVDQVSITLDSGSADWSQGFVKLARPRSGLWLFDHCGWQTIVRT